MNTITKTICFLIICGFAPACANKQFQQFGSSMLSSTGLVSGSQADAMFQAGGKIASAAGPLSAEQEYYLGRAVSAMILSKYRLSKNSGLNQYVNTVGNALVAYSDRPETFGGYHFAVIESEEANALSAPGGFVFISRGLLRLMPNEDALAAVLAHEIGHVANGHGVKAISQANLSSAAMILGKEAASSYGGSTVQTLTTALGDSVTEVFDTLLTKGYSRSQEYEADEFADDLLKRVGYPRASLVTMLTSLEKASAQEAGLFATHPVPKKRIGELSKESKKDVGSSSVRDARFAKFIKKG